MLDDRSRETVAKANNRALSADLVVVLPCPTEATEALSRVIDAAHERRSVAI